MSHSVFKSMNVNNSFHIVKKIFSLLKSKLFLSQKKLHFDFGTSQKIEITLFKFPNYNNKAKKSTKINAIFLSFMTTVSPVLLPIVEDFFCALKWPK